jgi:hypothetical protein
MRKINLKNAATAFVLNFIALPMTGGASFSDQCEAFNEYCGRKADENYNTNPQQWCQEVKKTCNDCINVCTADKTKVRNWQRKIGSWEKYKRECKEILETANNRCP